MVGALLVLQSIMTGLEWMAPLASPRFEARH
jgi:hypothetical protein